MINVGISAEEISDCIENPHRCFYMSNIKSNYELSMRLLDLEMLKFATEPNFVADLNRKLELHNNEFSNALDMKAIAVLELSESDASKCKMLFRYNPVSITDIHYSTVFNKEIGQLTQSELV